MALQDDLTSAFDTLDADIATLVTQVNAASSTALFSAAQGIVQFAQDRLRRVDTELKRVKRGE